MNYRIEQYRRGRFFLVEVCASRAAAKRAMKRLADRGVGSLFLVEGSSR